MSMGVSASNQSSVTTPFYPSSSNSTIFDKANYVTNVEMQKGTKSEVNNCTALSEQFIQRLGLVGKLTEIIRNDRSDGAGLNEFRKSLPTSEFARNRLDQDCFDILYTGDSCVELTAKEKESISGLFNAAGNDTDTIQCRRIIRSLGLMIKDNPNNKELSAKVKALAKDFAKLVVKKNPEKNSGALSKAFHLQKNSSVNKFVNKLLDLMASPESKSPDGNRVVAELMAKNEHVVKLNAPKLFVDKLLTDAAENLQRQLDCINGSMGEFNSHCMRFETELSALDLIRDGAGKSEPVTPDSRNAPEPRAMPNQTPQEIHHHHHYPASSDNNGQPGGSSSVYTDSSTKNIHKIKNYTFPSASENNDKQQVDGDKKGRHKAEGAHNLRKSAATLTPHSSDNARSGTTGFNTISADSGRPSAAEAGKVVGEMRTEKLAAGQTVTGEPVAQLKPQNTAPVMNSGNTGTADRDKSGTGNPTQQPAQASGTWTRTQKGGWQQTGQETKRTRLSAGSGQISGNFVGDTHNTAVNDDRTHSFGSGSHANNLTKDPQGVAGGLRKSAATLTPQGQDNVRPDTTDFNTISADSGRPSAAEMGSQNKALEEGSAQEPASFVSKLEINPGRSPQQNNKPSFWAQKNSATPASKFTENALSPSDKLKNSSLGMAAGTSAVRETVSPEKTSPASTVTLTNGSTQRAGSYPGTYTSFKNK